jgi:serine/threonine protein kinase
MSCIDHCSTSKRLKIDDLIGQGQFSNVYKHNVDSDTIARKQYKPRYKKYGKEEVKILQFLKDCSNIIDVLGFIDLGDSYSVLLPLYTYNLFVYTYDILGCDTKISFSNLKTVIISLLSGVSFMNKKGVTNTDIKLENILVNILPDGSLVVVISDFSSYIIWDQEKDDYLNNYNITTLWYRSILTVANAKKTEMMYIEMWMLACIIYETYNKKPLFETIYFHTDSLQKQNLKLLEKIFQQLGFPSDIFMDKYFPQNKDKLREKYGQYENMNSILYNELKNIMPYGNFIMNCLDYSNLNDNKPNEWLDFINMNCE